MNLIVLIELELPELDLALDILSPIIGFLLTVEVIAGSRVSFDADDRSPYGGAVFIFSFVNRCHSSNVWVLSLGWMALLVKIVLHCTASAPLPYYLNINLTLGQVEYDVSVMNCAG